MKIRVSDYIADFLADNGIRDVFTVVGGGAMYLNDSFGHNKRIHCTYNHHEQACAIAAESYARVENRIAVVCVTTGPGGTNALTGVVGGWLDSIPMLIISGQVRYSTHSRSTGLNIRSFGDQEFDITRSVDCMTKYTEMITDPKKIRFCLEKALYIATSGRPGPCWLDVPLDIQSAIVETDDLSSYDVNEYNDKLPKKPSERDLKMIIDKISLSKRPVLYAGNGIRLSGAFSLFKKVLKKLNIPVVTTFNSIDLMASDDPLYVGRGGIMGDRPGNFAVQNSDVLLCIGNRLSIREVGYNWKTWARESFVIMEDVDEDEMKKPSIHVEYPIHCDVKDLLCALDEMLNEKLFHGTNWIEQCQKWKKQYPVVMNKHYSDEERANVYCFINELSNRLSDDQLTVVGNGSACVVGNQAYVMKEKSRFIINSGAASMGYDLPAAIGACIANGRKSTICVTGDGSIQMNLQELQTIITNGLPIKIFVINNDGYHSIRQTQTNLFNSNYCGIDEQNGDLGFPQMSKIADVYGYPYYLISNNKQMDIIDEVLKEKCAICEIMVTTDQFFEPKSSTQKLPDGTLISPPLEDLAPFLSREELKNNMFIELMDEYPKD